MSVPLLEVRDLRKSYQLTGRPALEVLHGIQFSLNAGECRPICGPSGAGKSTLLHILDRNHLRAAPSQSIGKFTRMRRQITPLLQPFQRYLHEEADFPFFSPSVLEIVSRKSAAAS